MQVLNRLLGLSLVHGILFAKETLHPHFSSFEFVVEEGEDINIKLGIIVGEIKVLLISDMKEKRGKRVSNSEIVSNKEEER